jgi:hypothetical protein
MIAWALTAAAVWTVGLVGAIIAFLTVAVSQPQPWSGQMWFAQVTGLIGFILPFAAFAGGVAIRNGKVGGRGTATAALAGLVVGLVGYASAEVVSPLADYAALADDPDVAEIRPFGPRTPAGTLRQLSFLEANPPQAYRVGDPVRTPPNRVLLLFHVPIAFVAFAVLNCVLGHFVSRLTDALRAPSRRNACLATGLAGGLAFFGAAFLAAHPGRDWVAVSGVAAAWLPLAVPLVEALVLATIIRHRDSAFVLGAFDSRLRLPLQENSGP